MYERCGFPVMSKPTKMLIGGLRRGCHREMHCVFSVLLFSFPFFFNLGHKMAHLHENHDQVIWNICTNLEYHRFPG